MGYERRGIAAMTGYVPGRQPADGEAIKLNTNENPYPPAPAVLRALHEVDADALRRYPEPTARAFRERAATLHGVLPSELVAVNGGDELLRMAVTTFVEPGEPIGVLEPSYSLYPVLAEIHGSPVVRVPATGDFGVPPDFAARMNAAGVKLALLVNPHAPSGALCSRAQIAQLAGALHGVLLVDEAYVDFVDPALGHDLVPLLHANDNLLLLRTLSKGYSLAGLRFGYGVGCESLIAPLVGKTRDSYNVDAVAQRLACAALSSREHAERSWQLVREQRARVSRELRALGFRLQDSQSNFVLAYVPTPGPGATELLARLERGGVLVRHFAQDRLHDALRITIGSAAENDKLLSLLRAG